MQRQASPFTPDVAVAIAALYAFGFVVVFLAVGPWEATREFAVEGLILALWLWVAHRFLPGGPPDRSPIKRPALELSLGLLSIGLLAVGATGHFLGFAGLRWLALAALLPLAVLIGFRYDRQALGLINASRRAWIVLLAVIAINLLVGMIGGLVLPAGELDTSAGADLAEELTSPLSIFVTLAQVLLIAALPEELLFRVYLQPRLAHYVPVGWAIVIQALIFSALHLPQHLIRFGYPWAFALAGVLSINNGVLGGYLWWRTRSLQLLVILHLFAYPRYGL